MKPKVYYSDWRASHWSIEGGNQPREHAIYDSLTRILDAYEKALEKHPDNWPQDVVHMTAIMAEEAGEAVRAANDVVYSDASLEPLRQELAQTAAMCIRCLVNLEDRA